MTRTFEHGVSTLALDEYWVSGRPEAPALEAHLRDCAACRAYLRGLDEQTEADAPPLPARAARPATFGRWATAAGALALAAGLLLVVTRRPPSGDGYVGVKGTPAVQLLVRHGAATRIWGDDSPVEPGDALAVRVACEGLTVAATLTLDHGVWRRLSEGPCPEAPDEPLPFTLRVDDEPGDEQLAVVLSRHALSEAALQAAVQAQRRDDVAWAVQLTVPKRAEPGR